MTATAEIYRQCLEHFRAGRLPQAEALARDLANATPQDARVWHLHGVIIARRGRINDALGLFARALTLAPDSASVLLDQGIAYSRLERPEDALRCLDRAVELAPALGEAWNTRGRVLLDLGRPQEARASFDIALRERPDHADALANRGDTLRLLGENATALADYERALALKPNHAKAAYGRGIVLSGLGRLQEALQAFDRAVQLSPDLADAHCWRGMALHRLGDHAAALVSFAKVLSLEPRHVDALVNNAHALRAIGRDEEALASYERALAVNPSLPDVLVARGHLLSHVERHDEALACYDAALALSPDLNDARTFRAHAQRVVQGNTASSGAHFLRGETLRFLGRHAEAASAYDVALALRPDDAQAWNARGIALQEMGETAEALRSYDQALALEPHAAGALANRGAALRDLGRNEEAIATAKQALLHDPTNAGAHTSLGQSYRIEGRLDEALHHLAAAIAVSDNGSARFNRAVCLLLRGDFEEGWREYEWRWTLPGMAARRRKMTQPQWQGEEPVAGKTVMLYGEQGHGDTIQFCRYIPLLAAQGARIVLGVSPLIGGLMEQLDGVVQVFNKEDDAPPFDVHCPLLSLPLAFGTRLGSVPNQVPYLHAPASRVAEWAHRLGERCGLRIGIAWSGNLDHKDDSRRSIPLELLEPLLSLGPRFYCLQRELHPRDVPAFALHRDVEFLGPELRDFCDTAAVVAQMDLVISVDTAVLHLAGAMGRPAWGLLPFAPDWRWMLHREDSPWYPTMRLFRQHRAGDWPNVICRVGDAMQETAIDAAT